ncbi:MAG: hypothetical protein R3D88_02865 [Alphaproteobacteria bacterium]
MSDVAFASEERGTEAKSLALQAKKARLNAEAKGEEFKISEEIEEKFPDIARNEKALLFITSTKIRKR